MIIVNRQVGQAILIGDQVTITVLGVKGNQVRIGVDAPIHVSVHKEEIYAREQQGPVAGGNETSDSPTSV